VGSTLDSGFNWAHGFIYQDGKMTDLNTLFPASSNLFATMANRSTRADQISGMATVLSGPHAGDIHASGNSCNERIDRSVCRCRAYAPKSNLQANANKQLSHRFGLDRLTQ